MEQYIVSARKYRPSTFASVVGQEALTSTLKNAIATDRLAHAYLFCGSRGVGKTSCARIFAKTINCLNPGPGGEACNECESCRAFNDGNSLNIVELDAASHNGIDDIKSIIEQVQIPPTRGRYRVFIIDEVHMLSTAAFNAFLKTLEEPPSYVIFILATTEKHKIIPTILSRCQIYDFNRISINDMVAHLSHVAASEGITADPAALNIIARQADGAMRDALSIFDQVAASSRGNITYEGTIASLNVLDASYYKRLVDAFEKGDIPAALLVFSEVRRKGFDALFFINGLGEYLRELMLASSPATMPLLDLPDDLRADIAEQAARLKPDFLYAAMGLCNDADLNYRVSGNKQLLVELTLIRIAQLLSPSTIKSGRAGGPLKPIKKSEAKQATPAPTTESTSVAEPQQPYTPTAAATAQPTPPAAPRTAVPRTTRRDTTGAPIRVGGLSMHGSRTPDSGEAATHTRAESFTVAQIQDAWHRFGQAHAAEPALAVLIEKFAPIPGADPTQWSVSLDPTSARLLDEHLDELVEALRNAVRNDSISLRINVQAAGLGPEFWSDTQVLKHLLADEAFSKFYKDFHLKLL